jgi:cellulose synthase/poly-beta-1,6-N-acetylglucosamine synthase-like glycosyltransferase
LHWIDVYAGGLIAYFLLAIRHGIATIKSYATDVGDLVGSGPGREEFRAPIHIFLPLFHEQAMAGRLIRNFSDTFDKYNTVQTYVCVHHDDTLTVRAVEREVASRESCRIRMVVNRTTSHSKAAQLVAGLKEAEPTLTPHSIISVYDADSIADARILPVLNRWWEDTHRKPFCGALQQAPFYPIYPVRNALQAIAQARAIHSLVYHYCYEQPAYRASQSSGSFRMSVHLTGHGEHILYGALQRVGGFRQPSCDSSLGFALSYMGYSILPVAIPDISQTPLRIWDVWHQGLRWYRGCDLYWRELRRSGLTFSRGVQTYLTLWNNIRWFALWPITALVVLPSVFSGLAVIHLLVVVITSLCYIRHMLMFRAYRQMATISGIETARPSLWQWASYQFLAYVVLRSIWSMVPLAHYIRVLLRHPVKDESTPKR